MTMENRLNANQAEKVEKQYREHPLFQVCKAAFRRYEVEMKPLRFKPAELFREAAIMLDNILDESTSDVHVYILEQWDELSTKISRYEQYAEAEDIYKVTTAVFYVVTLVLRLQGQKHYAELSDLILEQNRKNSKISIEEEDQMLLDFAPFHDELRAWIWQYSDSSSYLSDEIESVISSQRKVVQMNIKEKRSDRKPPEVKNDGITVSFLYMPDGMDIGERNRRLINFYEELKKNGIFVDKETKQQDFLDIFMGGNTVKYIVWTNQIKRLSYLIRQLYGMGLISWAGKPKPKIVQMICARFKIRKKIFSEIEGKPKKDFYLEDCSLIPANFNTKTYEEDSELDKIIDVLVPDQMKKESEETIEDGVVNLFKDEQKEALSIEEQSQEGFHPTDHQSYHQS